MSAKKWRTQGKRPDREKHNHMIAAVTKRPTQKVIVSTELSTLDVISSLSRGIKARRRVCSSCKEPQGW